MGDEIEIKTMRRDKTLLISLISIILFSIFFLIILIIYNDTILFDASLKSFTNEYWNWYLDNVKIEGIIVELTSITKMFFSIILSLELMYIITNEKYKDIIDKKNLMMSIIIGFAINYLIVLLINYKAEHYRLFMTLISTEILSLVLLNIILNLDKRLN